MTKPVYRITYLAADEQPRERLASLGPQAFSSPDDVVVTCAIVQAGKLLDIDVLDRAS